MAIIISENLYPPDYSIADEPEKMVVCRSIANGEASRLLMAAEKDSATSKLTLSDITALSEALDDMRSNKERIAALLKDADLMVKGEPIRLQEISRQISACADRIDNVREVLEAREAAEGGLFGERNENMLQRVPKNFGDGASEPAHL